MDTERHWSAVYTRKGARDLSWYAEHLERSLSLIDSLSDTSAAVIDVGGGASTLVDDLLARGYRDITVLDVSAAALAVARERLGALADRVAWMVSDVRSAPLPAARFDLWHDRAVFHFLTDAADRAAYAEQARRAVRSNGHLVIATFALDGPARCSGLDVHRYDGPALTRELPGFQLVSESRETHLTPSGTPQQFGYFVLKKSG